MTKTPMTYRTRGERVVRANSSKKALKEKMTATVHLAMATHALGKLYAGYILKNEGRQLNMAQAIDELAIAGATVMLPHELLHASGFVTITVTAN